MSQVNGNVYPNTTFPDSIQTLPTFTDLSSADQANYINYLKAVIEGNISQANTYLNQITDTAIINANKLNILSDTINAIQQVYSSSTTFTDIINAKQAEWQAIINRFGYIGDWIAPTTYSSSNTYNKGDVILYNNDCWLCKINGTTSANPPAEGTYWTKTYLKNNIVGYRDSVDNKYLLYIALQNITTATNPYESLQWGILTKVGDIGANGEGFMFKNEWDSTVSYSIGNLVIYNGNAYSSLQNANLNQNPATATSYWKQEFVTTIVQIPVQSAEPTNQNVGDLWFQLI